MDRYSEREALRSLGATLVDRRSEPRYVCPHLPVIELSVPPSSGSFPGAVHDLSTQGVGLLCKDSIDPDTMLLLRVQPRGRTIPAQVIHVTPIRGGAFHIGCRLAELLEEDELRAHLLPVLDF